MNNILKPEEAIKFLLNGGKCKYINQKYIIIYKNGKFIIKDTGTLIGNFNNMIKVI